MPRGFTVSKSIVAATRGGVTAALICSSVAINCWSTLRASDLQSSTDEAAVEAKKNLCMSLNQGTESAELRDNFLKFYDGKTVSARRLNPNTFAKGQIGPLAPFRVVQVLGPNEMLASIDGSVFKLRDVSTADVADRQTIRSSDFYFVQDTETYDTVGGSTNTVYVLKPAKDKIPDIKPSRVYPWFNKKNEPFVIGEFKAIEGAQAVFLVDGVESRVTLSKFTPGDRAVMRILVERYSRDAPGKDAQGKSDKKPLNKPETKIPAQPVGID